MYALEPGGTYREEDLGSLGYEGEMFGVNIAVYLHGATVADRSFGFRADEGACRDEAGSIASDPGLLAAVALERTGYDVEAPGFEVEVSVESALVGAGGIEDSEFELDSCWHAGADGSLRPGRA